LPKRGNEGFVILRSVKFFCPEKFGFAVFPCALQHFNVEKLLELSWNILEECENAVVWVLVAEGVEDEAFFGYEGVSVSGNPVSS
jgi:hypothetical protein